MKFSATNRIFPRALLLLLKGKLLTSKMCVRVFEQKKESESKPLPVALVVCSKIDNFDKNALARTTLVNLFSFFSALLQAAAAHAKLAHSLNLIIYRERFSVYREPLLCRHLKFNFAIFVHYF